MAEAGLSPLEAIVAATSTAARACGIDAEAGTIEIGKVADLLVLEGDPLEDLRLFLEPSRVWLVLRDGKPVAGTRLRAVIDYASAATAAHDVRAIRAGH